MSGRPIARIGAGTAVLATLAAFSAAPAAADRIYWANFGAPERISSANLDGSGPADLNTSGAQVKIPIGLALDPAGGRAYWTNETAPGGISYASLDGGPGAGNLSDTGVAPVKGPSGAAIDPVGRRIYWGNIGDGTIGWANLDGSGGGLFNTAPATVNGPYGLEVDTVGRRLYWTNSGADKISYANLDGSGGADMVISGTASVQSPIGLAIVPAEGRIYWANSTVSGRISYANLNVSGPNVTGSGSADLNTTGATVAEPMGVAVDPDLHRVYWANSSGGLASADTRGTGGANLIVGGGFATGALNFPNLLEAPRGTAPPAASGSPKPGGALSCGIGGWAEDIASASLYRAPTSYAYQWSRSGNPVAGATAPTLTAQEVGEYRCAVTASNPAGSASQASPVAAVFKIGKPKLDTRKGTAKVPVSVPGSGTLKVSGKGCKGVGKAAGSATTLKLRIGAKGGKLKGLRASGKAKLKLTFAFSTSDGGLATQKKSIVLRQKKK